MSKSAAYSRAAKKPETKRPNANEVRRQNSLGTHVCVQREAIDSAVHPAAPTLVRSVLEAPGQPLDKTTRELMEPHFGRDFSGVRVHTDETAAKSARALNAKAYTAGTHVAFGSGQYQ